MGKKLRGRKGKKGPRLGQVQQGTTQSYRVEAEGLSLPVLAAVRYQMICRQASGLAAPLCRILLAAAGRLSSSDPPNGFGSDSTLMLVHFMLIADCSIATVATGICPGTAARLQHVTATADKDSLTERHDALRVIAATVHGIGIWTRPAGSDVTLPFPNCTRSGRTTSWAYSSPGCNLPSHCSQVQDSIP